MCLPLGKKTSKHKKPLKSSKRPPPRQPEVRPPPPPLPPAAAQMPSSSSDTDYAAMEAKTQEERRARTQRKTRERTVDEERDDYNSTLKLLGANVNAHQIELLMAAKQKRNAPVSKAEREKFLKQGDIVYSLRSLKKRAGKDDDTERPKVLPKEKSPDDQDGDGCDTPGPGEEFIEDPDMDDITEDNYMFHPREIMNVCHMLIRDGTPSTFTANDEDDEEEKARKKLVNEYAEKVKDIPWSPFRPLEQMEQELEAAVFSCLMLRRNTFLSATVTLPKTAPPKPTKTRKSQVTPVMEIRQLNDFPSLGNTNVTVIEGTTLDPSTKKMPSKKLSKRMKSLFRRAEKEKPAEPELDPTMDSKKSHKKKAVS